jgi:hypothetical protein
MPSTRNTAKAIVTGSVVYGTRGGRRRRSCTGCAGWKGCRDYKDEVVSDW